MGIFIQALEKNLPGLRINLHGLQVEFTPRPDLANLPSRLFNPRGWENRSNKFYLLIH